MLLYIFQLLQGLPRDIARSLGEYATLTNVLQTLDEHYGMLTMFDTFSKELYCFKQGSRENVAVFRVCLSEQVQILQMLTYIHLIIPKRSIFQVISCI